MKIIPSGLDLDTDIDSLQQLLANSFGLMILAQKNHYNITGTSFPGVHKLFEDQFEYLFEFIDDLAERIRELGGFPEVSLPTIASRSTIQTDDFPGDVNYEIMTYRTALLDFIKEMRDIISELMPSFDYVSANWLTDELAWFEKQLWKFTAIVEGLDTDGDDDC